MFSATGVCLAILTFIFIDSTSGFYSPSDNIIILNDSNFDKLVLKDKALWVVEFYATACKYCKEMVPEYKKLAKSQKGVIKVGAADVGSEKALRSQYIGVGGSVPNILIFGANKRSPTKYTGPRTADAIAKAALAAKAM